jgi:hypothetical protein
MGKAVEFVKRDFSREAAQESSQGQDRGPQRGSPAGVEARSAPPLELIRRKVARPEGAQGQYSQAAPPFLRTPSGCEHLFVLISRGCALTRLPLATLFHSFGVRCAVPLIVLIISPTVFSQTPTYPKEIRGYKVERAAVEVKKQETKTNSSGGNKSQTNNQDSSSSTQQPPEKSNADSDVDQLITFGRPQLARVTPLGITFEVPVVVAPVKQSGHVDFLLFQDMTVNGHSVEIDEYHRAFDLPTKKPLTLRDPLRFYIYLPTALLAAAGEWSESKGIWPVTGRVYACGKFKKFLFSFKRCVPVELDLEMKNPLRGQ